MYYKNYKNPSVPAAAVAEVGPWGMTKDDFGLNWRQHRQQLLSVRANLLCTFRHAGPYIELGKSFGHRMN